MNITITALHQLSTGWSEQHISMQHKALTLLKWLLECNNICLQPVTAILCKSLLVQLSLSVSRELSLDREVALDSEQVKFLLASLSSTASDRQSLLSIDKAIQEIGYLVMYTPNKEALVDVGTLDHLADIVEGCPNEEQNAAELIYFIMDQSVPIFQREQPVQVTNTDSNCIASGLNH